MAHFTQLSSTLQAEASARQLSIMVRDTGITRPHKHIRPALGKDQGSILVVRGLLVNGGKGVGSLSGGCCVLGGYAPVSQTHAFGHYGLSSALVPSEAQKELMQERSGGETKSGKGGPAIGTLQQHPAALRFM